ncbi:hypothetical protein BH09MYX1_BH09MYX1_16190 [soil metagenome]
MNEGWVALARLFPLLLLSPIVTQIVTASYAGIKRRIDAKLPDDLPLGAGPWLESEIALRGLDLRVVVDPLAADEADSFIPDVDVIILSREVYRKRDASFCAVAAHELGHAVVYRSSSALRTIFTGARFLARVGAAVAMTLLVANVFYRIAAVDRLAFNLCRVALGAHVVLIADEVSATVFALRTLRRAGLARRARIGAFGRLASALMTYVAAFLAQLFVVVQAVEIARQIEERGEPSAGGPLGLAMRGAVLALAVVVLALALHTLARALRPRRAASSREAQDLERWRTRRESGRSVLACVIVLLVWDQPNGLVLELACVAAIVGSRPLLARISTALDFFLSTIMSLVAQPFVARWRSRARRGGASVEPPALLEDWARYDEVALAYYNHQPWLRRAASAGHGVLHVVFVGIVCFVIMRG